MSTTEIAEHSGDRDAKGHFLPGHAVKSPGRPPGSLDFVATCRKRARAEGKDLEEMLWQVVKAIHAEAIFSGDVKAAQLFVDRFCGLLEKETGVQVNINNGTVNNGPPEPTTRDLGVYFERLGELSGKLQTVELEPKTDEVEELLG